MAVVISLRWNIPTAADLPTGFSLDPSLTVAVLGIFDVLACVQQRLAVKAPVDISAMRSIAAIIYNVQQSVALLDALDSAHSAATFTFLTSFSGFILHEPSDLLS